MNEPRPPLGLRAQSALVLAVVLIAGAACVRFLHAPWLRTRVVAETDALVRASVEAAEAAAEADRRRMDTLLRASTDHLVNRWARDLEDLPFELVAGRPDAVRGLVADEVAAVGRASRENARVLAAEVRRRSEARTALLEETLRARQQDIGRAAAADLALSSSLLVLGLIAAAVGLQGFLVGRAVVRPVRRLSAGAERLAAGDLAHRVTAGGSRELVALGRDLNRMAADIERANDEVRALNEGLERRVREKSAALVRAETLASLGTLAGGIAHEFNNLLGGILGTAEEALHDTAEPEVRDALELVVRTARRGCAITDNLLRFARPREPRVETVDAAAVLHDAASLVDPEATRRGVTVTVAGGAAPLRADPSELHQVVLNLLANAVTFTPEGGRVEAAVSDDGDDCVITVRDTGPGIPAAVLPRLFEPFFTTRGAEGTGLGLAVSHGIVRAHGGSLAAADHPDGGARFTVRLPRDGGEGEPS